jgi:hypothetical protein
MPVCWSYVWSWIHLFQVLFHCLEYYLYRPNYVCGDELYHVTVLLHYGGGSLI